MKDQNFSTSFQVDYTPGEVFHAINNVRGWWPEETEEGSGQLHDEFTYHYQDVHRCKMKIIEFIPDKK